MRYTILYLLLASMAVAQVVTNSQGQVVTGNAAFDALMGPIVPLGNSAWPWFDDRMQTDANVQIAAMDTYYGAYWDVADAGTITVVNNSAAVIGVGTHFLTTFCNSLGVANGTQIIVWYPVSTGVTGRRMIPVSGCTSDTILTMGQIWYTDVNSGSGLGYSDNSNWGSWHYGEAPANYYDVVAGLYSIYYRTGTTSYLTAARKLADRFWTCPEVDRGHAYSHIGSVPHGAWASRQAANMGLFLRAVDSPPISMWAGLEEIVDSYWWGDFDPSSVAYLYGWLPSVYDAREVGYALATVSYCALLDPTGGATCKGYLSTLVPGYFTSARFSDGSWKVFGGDTYSWTDRYGFPQTCVYLTHGSTAVSGLASGCGSGTWYNTSWVASQFVPGWPGGCSGVGCVSIPIWFVNDPKVQPATNTAGDTVVYTPTWNNATSLTLDRPYEGSTGIHGWVIGSHTDNPVLGWGASVYSLGMLSQAFHLVADAIAVSDPTNSALARAYANSSSLWNATVGYRAATKSSYYNAGYVNCQAPIPETANACTAYLDPDLSRPFSSEDIRPMIESWNKTGNITYKNIAVILFNALWAKPGTCTSSPCVSDGYYFTQFDTNLSIYPYLTNPGAPKWYGQQWGYPNTNTLDGYLGLAPPSIIGVSISGSMRSGSKLP